MQDLADQMPCNELKKLIEDTPACRIEGVDLKGTDITIIEHPDLTEEARNKLADRIIDAIFETEGGDST